MARFRIDNRGIPSDITGFGSNRLFNAKFRSVDNVVYYGAFVAIFHVRIVLNSVDELIRDSHNFGDLIFGANNCVVSVVKEFGGRIKQSFEGIQLTDPMIER